MNRAVNLFSLSFWLIYILKPILKFHKLGLGLILNPKIFDNSHLKLAFILRIPFDVRKENLVLQLSVSHSTSNKADDNLYYSRI